MAAAFLGDEQARVRVAICTSLLAASVSTSPRQDEVEADQRC
jgi:hypothetical protein